MARTRSPHAPEGPPLKAQAWQFLEATFRDLFANPTQERGSWITAFDSQIPLAQRNNVNAVLERSKRKEPTKPYRVGLVIQLAFALSTPERLDITYRHPGARGTAGVAGKLGDLLRSRHVVSSVDVYQNIGKNDENLIRNNCREFDRFLQWASGQRATKEQLRTVFQYACLKIAGTARPIRPLPEINQAKLTFANVMALFHELLAAPSGGAHEQFIIASLLHSRLEQTGSQQRVETKNLNASDQSSRTAADVQVKTGTRTDEAYEVTANEWKEKLGGAAQTIRAHDLSRLHILAQVEDFPEMIRILKGLTDDISALDLRAFIAVLTSELRKQFRTSALRRLYELLDRLQPNTDLVNAYVERLQQQGLTN